MNILRTRTAARFIQIFEAEGGTVYRLWTPSRNDGERLSIRAAGSALDALVRQWEPEVVSIQLEGAPTSFEVLDDGGAVRARMTPARFERIRTRQNLCTVNPAIDGAFGPWCAKHAWAETSEPAPCPTELGSMPRMSLVVPLWRTPLPYFHAMVRSVLAQTYPRWELVLVNASPKDANLAAAAARYASSDARIRVLELPENRGIAGNTNVGLRAATGDYVGFLDHDDLLAPRALEAYARAIAQQPETDLLYCDEDSIREGLDDRCSPIFKPDLNLDLLYSHNYVEHLLMVSRWALERIELAPDDVSGAQDYDLTLKAIEVARAVAHVPELLYHWRAHAGSTNGGIMEGKPYAIAASERAVKRHLVRRGAGVQAVEETSISCVFRTTYAKETEPVSMLVAFEDEGRLLRLVSGIAAHAGDRRIEVVAAGPQVAHAAALRAAAGNVELQLATCDDGGGRAALLNAARAHASHELLLLCTDAVAFDRPDCLSRLAACLAARPDAGVVAPKLFYPDGLVQHAGLYVLPDGTLGFLNQNFREGMGGGYLGLAECSCAYSAVGPDCFAVRRADLEAAGGLDERYGNALLAVADLCFKLRAAGKACIVLPEAQATCAAPVLWDERGALAAYGRTDTLGTFWKTWASPTWRRDVLEHPSITMEHGYLQLDVGRDIDRETGKIILRNKLEALKRGPA